MLAIWLCAWAAAGTMPDGLSAQEITEPEGPAAPLVPPASPQPTSPQPTGPSSPANPRPSGTPVELGGDRPRTVPEPLSQGRILPEKGVEVSVGALSVSVDVPQLHFNQGPQSPLADGAMLAADVVLQNWRFSYSVVLLRRPLPTGATYLGAPVDSLGVDIDQFWVFYGFRPVHSLYLGPGLAYEYRLTRLSSMGNTIGTVTENLGAVGLIADWAIAPPVMLQLRVFQEDGGHFLTVGGTTYQFGYIVPF